MPYDSNGIFSLAPGYLAIVGQVIQPSQHNPPLEDIIGAGLSNVVVRDGRAPMTGNLKMGTFKITGMGDGTLSTDAASKGQLSAQSPGFLYRLQISNNSTDLTNDIDVAAGAAAEEGVSLPSIMTLPSALTKRTDAAWSAGTNQGGWLDGASMPNGVGHVFLMYGSGGVDVGISASLSPTLPAAYNTGKRRIGSIIRAAAAILPFIQHEDTFWHNNATNGGVLDINVNNPGTSAATRTLSVPTGIQVDAIINLGVNNTSGVSSITTATPLELAAVSPGSTFASGLWNGTPGTGSAIGVQGHIRTNTSGQIRTQTSVSGASLTLQIGTLGWIDSRGRFG